MQSGRSTTPEPETPSGGKGLLSLVEDVADDVFLESEVATATQTEQQRVTVEAVDPGGAVRGV